MTRPDRLERTSAETAEDARRFPEVCAFCDEPPVVFVQRKTLSGAIVSYGACAAHADKEAK